MPFYLDKKAVALLPLACEYQIENLKTDSIEELKKVAKPRLEYVTLAHRYDLKELLEKALEACKDKVHSNTLDREREQPENQGLPLEVYFEIIR